MCGLQACEMQTNEKSCILPSLLDSGASYKRCVGFSVTGVIPAGQAGTLGPAVLFYRRVFIQVRCCMFRDALKVDSGPHLRARVRWGVGTLTPQLTILV